MDQPREPIEGDAEDMLVGVEEIGPDDELDEGDLEAIADIEAGRFISHEAMKRWLESWGTENELPPPECGT